MEIFSLKKELRRLKGADRKKNVGAEEAQAVKCLPHKRKDPTPKSHTHDVVLLTLSTGMVDRKMPELAGQSKQPVSSGLLERPCL